MATFYDVILTTNIPHGSDILNKPCTVLFAYPDGSHSDPPGKGTVFAWLTKNSVRISSAMMNIEAGFKGATGGTLAIQTKSGLSYGIWSFSKT